MIDDDDARAFAEALSPKCVKISVLVIDGVVTCIFQRHMRVEYGKYG